MSLTFLHDRIATAAFLFALICGLWGIANYVRGQGVSANYWGAVVVGEVLMIVQGIIGLLLYLQGHLPVAGSFIHILYGVLAVMAWPAAYAYTQGKDSRRESLIYGLVGIFLVGATVRGIITGGGSFSL